MSRLHVSNRPLFRIVFIIERKLQPLSWLNIEKSLGLRRVCICVPELLTPRLISQWRRCGLNVDVTALGLRLGARCVHKAHMSDSQQVFLRHVSLRTSGLYRCEVSAEAPSFTSVHGDGHMEVISLPQEDPQITGEEKVYASGDILALNCTSSKSFPPARLKWFINGVPARSDYEALIQQHGLVSSVSGLRLEVGPHHLTEGKINVRCEATVQSSRPIKEPLIDYRKAQVFVQGSAYLPRPCLMLLVGFLTVTRLLALS
ncbi:uncharacterized protein [Neodiprion pinetum]|uniref:Uncharacterized protein LOC107216975 isoform X2 n=1 Tax=Neodiprion lecontei TaxID=441921 RepID=A0ABM3FKT6_NEOLC|nr:uncharacterized protein LOC124213101 isoform X2 [Neodiprion pinetum]XP_046588642.1 uncharacterized protein LOC107216975 isoform X2 [Neodiprion lecontei]